jgi:hypothetical protein
MKMIRTFHLFLAVTLHVASLSCHAQDARSELVRKIAASQGLLEMFDQQITQQRESVKGYASDIFQRAVTDSGGQANEKERAAFERFVGKTATIFSASEMEAAWIASYGKDLTVDDLAAILRYYESPIGRKDVAANKLAMVSFSAWASREGRARATALLQGLILDLQEARK